MLREQAREGQIGNTASSSTEPILPSLSLEERFIQIVQSKLARLSLPAVGLLSAAGLAFDRGQKPQVDISQIRDINPGSVLNVVRQESNQLGNGLSFKVAEAASAKSPELEVSVNPNVITVDLRGYGSRVLADIQDPNDNNKMHLRIGDIDPNTGSLVLKQLENLGVEPLHADISQIDPNTMAVIDKTGKLLLSKDGGNSWLTYTYGNLVLNNNPYYSMMRITPDNKYAIVEYTNPDTNQYSPAYFAIDLNSGAFSSLSVCQGCPILGLDTPLIMIPNGNYRSYGLNNPGYVAGSLDVTNRMVSGTVLEGNRDLTLNPTYFKDSQGNQIVFTGNNSIPNSNGVLYKDIYDSSGNYIRTDTITPQSNLYLKNPDNKVIVEPAFFDTDTNITYVPTYTTNGSVAAYAYILVVQSDGSQKLVPNDGDWSPNGATGNVMVKTINGNKYLIATIADYQSLNDGVFIRNITNGLNGDTWHKVQAVEMPAPTSTSTPTFTPTALPEPTLTPRPSDTPTPIQEPTPKPSVTSTPTPDTQAKPFHVYLPIVQN